ARPDAGDVHRGRSCASAAREVRVRSGAAAQSRQGISAAASLRRARAHACAPGRRASSGPPALLMTSSVATMLPADAQDLTQLVQAALADRTPLQIVGGDSKGGMAYPQRDVRRVSTAKFDRIVDYDPAELVLTVGAGAKLSSVQTLLAEHDQ